VIIFEEETVMTIILKSGMSKLKISGLFGG